MNRGVQELVRRRVKLMRRQKLLCWDRREVGKGLKGEVRTNLIEKLKEFRKINKMSLKGKSQALGAVFGL